MIYDAIVIGSGASGGAVAHQLCQAGFKVALLEKGRLIRREEFSKDELAYCRRDIVTPSLFDEYHTIEEFKDGKWIETPTYDSNRSFWNGNIVGGSSNLMSGMFHRMHPDDFRLLSRFGEIEGANIVDWPISYRDMEPYYRLAEELVGVSGKAQSHPHKPPRSTLDLPLPPTSENMITTLFDKSCRRLKITPLITSRAVLSQERGDRKACYYSNFCGSYGCSSGAKGSSLEAFVNPALATGNLTLLTNSYVKRLESNQESVTAVEVIDTITGESHKLHAEIYVVAAQAHESSRLLLNSANSFHPDGLGNSSGELGKNLIFSAGGFGQGLLSKKSLKDISFDAFMQRGLFINRSILDWYMIDPWWGRVTKGGLVEFMFEHQNNISRAAKTRYSGERLLWGEDLALKLRDLFTEGKSIRFEIFNDWLPTDDCFVSLDLKRRDKYGMPVGKLRIHGHPHDLKIASKISEKCEQLLAEMGAEDIYSSISATPPQNLVAGGCRFGRDPKRSLLNPYCQSHDIPNLFVADASFMPTGGSTPYTWTIYANALRISDYMIGELQKGRFS
ncbi:MAG: GMC family oxidoreductase [Campylobacterota bacterium]|nr:GMC family oxidoreductase [Campylobacterota bacterium]